MPGSTLPPAPEPEPAPEPIPDEDQGPPPDEDEPQGRRGGVVGELVEERAARRLAEQQAASAQDLLKQVMQSPDGLALLQRVASGTPAAQGPDPQEAYRQECEATAIDLGLYDDKGQPDLQSAHRIMQREERRVQAQVQRAVQHLQQTELAPLKQQRVEQTIQHVKAVAQHYGIDPDMVERGLRTIPAEQIGNPEVQQTVLMTALGLQTFGGATPPQGPVQRERGPNGQFAASRGALRPPIYQEPSGGRPRSAPQLDEPFRARLRESGLKDQEINASLDRFVPGAPNRLE
jgi:hypothetical protein